MVNGLFIKGGAQKDASQKAREKGTKQKKDTILDFPKSSVLKKPIR